MVPSRERHGIGEESKVYHLAINRPRILRYRTIISHATPTRRQVTEELTLYNDGKETVDYVVLHAHSYRPGMSIVDQDGTILGFIPNEIVRGLLQESSDSGDLILLDEINRREKYIQWITLPKEKPFESGKTRVIRISYTDSARPGRTLGSPSKWLFNIPEFDVEKDTPPSEMFPSNVTITAPEGFCIHVEKSEALLVQENSSREALGSDHYHINASDNIVDVNLPHVPLWNLQFRLTYGVYPDRSEQRVLGSFVVLLLIFSTSLLASLLLQPPRVPPSLNATTTTQVGPSIRSEFSSLASFVALVSLAFIGLTTNPLTHRTKYWAALTLGLSILTILLSST